MRQAYIVTYDIASDARLRQVYKLMRGHGEHLQLSVFRCELSGTEVIELKARLGEIIHHERDQVLFVDLGPSEGRAATCISALGRAYTPPERRALII